MFSRIFDWLDRTIRGNGERWENLLEFIPTVLFAIQCISLGYRAAIPECSNLENFLYLIFDAFLVFISICFCTFVEYAKKKYKITPIWIRLENILVPCLIIVFFVLHIISIISQCF